MKSPKLAYFPVLPEEQAVLERLRMPDLAGRRTELVAMLDLLAEGGLGAADLEQAITLLAESRRSEALDARFQNLEARLSERIEKGLAEIEGRLSKHLVAPVDAPTGAPAKPPSPAVAKVPPPPPPKPKATEVPPNANLAFRIAGELVWGPSAAQFYKAVWQWLFDNGHVTSNDLPISGGKQRYVIATTPVHPNGKPFFQPQKFGDAYIELNMSRENIAARAAKQLQLRNIPFEVLVGPQP